MDEIFGVRIATKDIPTYSGGVIRKGTVFEAIPREQVKVELIRPGQAREYAHWQHVLDNSRSLQPETEEYKRFRLDQLMNNQPPDSSGTL